MKVVETTTELYLLSIHSDRAISRLPLRSTLREIILFEGQVPFNVSTLQSHEASDPLFFGNVDLIFLYIPKEPH